MNFENHVKNKKTEIQVRRGDDVMTITHEYDIEGSEQVMNDFELILKFFTFIDPAKTIKDYYRDEIIDEWIKESEDENK